MANSLPVNLRPSGSARRLQCPGSVMAEAPLVGTVDPDPITLEGLEAHAYAAKAIPFMLQGAVPPPPKSEVERVADIYIQEVISDCRSCGVFGGPHIGVEQPVTVPRIHMGYGGTPDFWMYHASTKTLYVKDLKAGYRLVEAKGNTQLTEYAAGIMYYLDLNDTETTVKLCIVQPRAYHPLGPVRTWTVKGSELRPYINQLAASFWEAIQPEPTFRTGPRCRDCLAKLKCAAFLARRQADLEEATKRPATVDLSAHDTGLLLQITREAIDGLGWLAIALEADAELKIAAGETVPGWARERGKGSLRWSKPIAEVIALGDLCGIDIRKPEAPLTPKQAIAAGLAEEVVDCYSDKQPGAYNLVPASETLAGRVFTKSR